MLEIEMRCWLSIDCLLGWLIDIGCWLLYQERGTQIWKNRERIEGIDFLNSEGQTDIQTLSIFCDACGKNPFSFQSLLLFSLLHPSTTVSSEINFKIAGSWKAINTFHHHIIIIINQINSKWRDSPHSPSSLLLLLLLHLHLPHLLSPELLPPSTPRLRNLYSILNSRM